MGWLLIAIWAVSWIATYLLAPKPDQENARPGKLDDLNFPQAKDGTPVAIVMGKVRLRAPNTIWYGDFRSIPIKESSGGFFGFFESEQTVGYHYFVGFDLGLCLGPNTHLRRIWIDKHEVFSGDVGPGESSIVVNKPNLFGGRNKGGGFVAGANLYMGGIPASPFLIGNAGPLRFYGGSFTQPVNAYLDSKLADVPAYNGLSHIVAEGVYIGTQAALREMSFELSRYDNQIGMPSGDLIIGEDLNPIECLYEILIGDWGGLDVDPNDVDVSSFLTAAATLKAENNGMSLLITKPNSGKSVVTEILRQIDGIMYQHPQTAKIVLKLIRNDYSIPGLPVLNDDNCKVRNYKRSSWDDTYNQVRVLYTRRSAGSQKYEPGATIDQDMANINMQGRIRNTNISFPGCYDDGLAVALATREKTQLSVPLSGATLEITRFGQQILPGSVFKWTNTEYGITDMIMRCQRLDLGSLLDGRVVIQCVQDRFAINTAVYGAPEDTLWDPVTRDAVIIADADDALYEVPYWIMQYQNDVPVPPIPGKGHTFAFAKQTTTMEGYSAYLSQDNWATAVVGVDRRPFINSAVLSTASIGINDAQGLMTISSITVNGVTPNANFLKTVTTTDIRTKGENLFFIGDELMAYESFSDLGGGSYQLINVHRAMLDTTQGAHSSGARLWFLTDMDGLAHAEFDALTTIKAKFLSFTDRDEFPWSSATERTRTMNRRYDRPLPPRDIRVNASRADAQVVNNGGAPISINFVRRNRLDASIYFENDTGTDSSEPSPAVTTFTARLYVGGILRDTVTGITGNSTTLNPGGNTGGARVEIDAIRDGLTSFNFGVYRFTIT